MFALLEYLYSHINSKLCITYKIVENSSEIHLIKHKKGEHHIRFINLLSFELKIR